MPPETSNLIPHKRGSLPFNAPGGLFTLDEWKWRVERVSFEKKEWAADERRDSRWRSGDKNVERLDVRTGGGIGIGTWGWRKAGKGITTAF